MKTHQLQNMLYQRRETIFIATDIHSSEYEENYAYTAIHPIQYINII